MQMTHCLANKIKRQIEMNGRMCTFIKYKKDRFGQTSSEEEGRVEAKGIFHTTNNYIKESDSEGARLISKPQPMILLMYDDGSKVSKDDTVTLGENLYRVVEKKDVNNFGIAYDVSLELVYVTNE